MFTLTGNSSVLTSTTQHAMELGNKDDWECALVSFNAYNSIPNVEEGVNNVFVYGEKKKKIHLPEGSYEINDINEYIKSHLEKGEKIEIIANNNTLKCEIKSNQQIDFTAPTSIASLLGFDHEILPPNKRHASPHPVSIMKVNAILIDCNIARGSFINGVEGHTLFQFSPNVAPGFKIEKTLENRIYMPVNTDRIQVITVRILDQEGRLINFRGETITVGIHVRRKRWV